MIESELCPLLMAKGFRLRLRCVFPAAFRSCRSRDDDTVVAAAVSAPTYCLPPVSSDCFNVVELLPPSPLRRRLQPPLIPSRRSRRSLCSPPRYLCSASASGGGLPTSPRRIVDYDDGNAMHGRGDGCRPRRRKETIRRRWCDSSSANEDSGWFGSDEFNGEFYHYYGDGSGAEEEEEEREALISSTDVDSSDSYFWQRRTKTITGRDGGRRRRSWAPEDAAVAVVKRSEDPRGDFRRSMAEMVVDKKIFDAAGLEELLICFLLLNSRDHHAAIIAAFGDVWAAVSPAPAVAAGNSFP